LEVLAAVVVGLPLAHAYLTLERFDPGAAYGGRGFAAGSQVDAQMRSVNWRAESNEPRLRRPTMKAPDDGRHCSRSRTPLTVIADIERCKMVCGSDLERLVITAKSSVAPCG
jgi:hypothetical protein